MGQCPARNDGGIAMDNTPRYRLTELMCNLRRGDTKEIARLAHCSCSTVSKVLNGKANQTTATAQNIIRIAEEMARRNQWRRPKKE